MALRFGTDGIRGLANVELTPEMCVQIGMAAAEEIASPGETVYVGRDTRLSGPGLQAALTAGLCCGGCNVLDLGILPTPALAHFGRRDKVASAVVSASHNPYFDNGIKFFSREGTKLNDDVQSRFESRLADIAQMPSDGRKKHQQIGTVSRTADGVDQYVTELTKDMTPGVLTGLRFVVDCSNGASSVVAPLAFSALGADVIAINDSPNGVNINDKCGSTDLSSLIDEVKSSRANCGFAFDGDADRVLAVDENGNDIDGDQLIFILARSLRSVGLLYEDTVVLTTMSNLGTKHAFRDINIRVVETDVGDRYVFEAMKKGRYSIGGEQSGHIIYAERSLTGDGVLAALEVAAVIARTQQSLGALASPVKRFPQVLQNIQVADKSIIHNEKVQSALRRVEDELGDDGRVLLRPSGTEPKIRVMVEAQTIELANRTSNYLTSVVKSII